MEVSLMKITKDMGILTSVEQYPEIVKVYEQYGMHCFGCMAARFENIAEGAGAHGIDVDALMKDLNAAVID